jgi:hypothetical protein
METYGGEVMRDKILAAIANLPDTHPLKYAELLQGKRNKNKWAWSIHEAIDKNDNNIIKWYSDRLLAVYAIMEDMAL